MYSYSRTQNKLSITRSSFCEAEQAFFNYAFTCNKVADWDECQPIYLQHFNLSSIRALGSTAGSNAGGKNLTGNGACLQHLGHWGGFLGTPPNDPETNGFQRINGCFYKFTS